MANVLIIDNDPNVCDSLACLVQRMGLQAKFALTLRDGLREATAEYYDVVFLDVGMPDGNGLDFLPRIHSAPSEPEVIIITGAGDADSAELAIRSGAWDYIVKPFSAKSIKLSLRRALQYRQEKAAAKKPPVALKFQGIVGSSPAMRTCYDRLAQAARSEANVLITGETGTGKELFARAVHLNSSRAPKKLIVFDCTILPESLLAATLCGHVKGAFTGALEDREGLIKQADGGTLFLDEIGELPLEMQKSFLRILQERQFRPLGGKRELTSNFRLITATNRHLERLVEKGKFRSDLLFRLQSLTIDLPPLRERRQDIIFLALYHLSKICNRNGIGIKGLSPEFSEALMSYDWPGNVRELINSLEWAISAAYFEPTLFPQHLPTRLRVKLARASVTSKEHEGNPPLAIPDPNIPSLREARAAMEQHYLNNLMSLSQGDIKQACSLSGLSQSRLYALLKKHSIEY